MSIQKAEANLECVAALARKNNRECTKERDARGPLLEPVLSRESLSDPLLSHCCLGSAQPHTKDLAACDLRGAPSRGDAETL